MTSRETVLDYMGRALWDPTPTGSSDLRARQLAAGLGYPVTWRVVRTLEHCPVLPSTLTKEINNKEGTVDVMKNTTETQETVASETPQEPITTTSFDETKDTSNVNDGNENVARRTTKTTLCIVDRIYAGKPGTGCDMWVHHEAAMGAALSWNDGTTPYLLDDDLQPVQDTEHSKSTTYSTPFSCKGGHLLPRVPKYTKGDKVQVLYEDEWWDASISRPGKFHQASGTIRYQVHYTSDGSKQSGVEEELIRQRPQAQNPKKVAATLLGIDETSGWEAYKKGNNRWKIVAPNGEIFTSKKKAMDAYNASVNQTITNPDEGGEDDPPWRTTGNDYLGRRVIWSTQYKPSARRTVQIDQVGTVTGWISEKDVDKAGEPGFVSERTGQPARLFHLKFDDEPHHPYASCLVESQDVEEYELLECLLPEGVGEKSSSSPAKKKRKR